MKMRAYGSIVLRQIWIQATIYKIINTIIINNIKK